MPPLGSLIKTGKSVFTLKELADIWKTDKASAKVMAHREVKKNEIFRIKTGYYSLKKDYDNFELGCKMASGSYISTYTALKEYGVIFQELKTIYLVAPKARVIKINEVVFEYHTIKSMLFLEKGVHFNNFYSIAGLERAVLDSFSIFNTDFSDFNISSFDKNLFLELLPFYNKRVQKKAEKFLNHFNL